jgi:hypothetical protein
MTSERIPPVHAARRWKPRIFRVARTLEWAAMVQIPERFNKNECAFT